MRTVSISRHRRELERKCDKFSRRVRNAKQNEQSYQNGISRVDCVRAVLSLALQKSAFGQNAPLSVARGDRSDVHTSCRGSSRFCFIRECIGKNWPPLRPPVT